MQSNLAEALGLKYAPVAVLLAHQKPAGAAQFQQGKMGCVAAMMIAAAKGRTAAFDRKTFGCPGGGTGLGLGDCYVGFPIEQLLSTGGKAQLANGATYDMREGERFHASPEVTRGWVRQLPMRELPAEYLVLKPLDQVAPKEQVSLVHMLVNPDQLSALVTLAGFRTGAVHTTVAPWGAACQSILYAFAEAEREDPRGVMGFFDVSQRDKVDRETLSFTAPYKLFAQMQADVEASFLGTEVWRKLRDRR